MPNLVSVGRLPEAIISFYEHAHTQWELINYTLGTGKIIVDGKGYDFFPGKIFCIPPGAAHTESSEHGFNNIFIVVDDFEIPHKDLPVYTDVEDGDLYGIIMQMYKVFHKRPENWNNIARGLLDVLYLYLLSWSATGEKSLLVERFKNILVANLCNERFAIEHGLDEIPLANDYFRSIFKRKPEIAHWNT